MSITLIVLSFVTMLNLGLALLVYNKDPSRWINRIFAIFAMTVAGWTAGTYLGTTYAETPAGLLAGRAAFAMAGLSVYALLVFLHIFPGSLRLPRSYPVKGFATLAAILTLVAMTTPWIVANIAIEEDNLKVQYGPLYPLFAFYILSCVSYSFFLIVRKMRAARSVERLQLKYIFVGLLVSVLLATVTNLLIPLAFGTSQFSHYGPLFSFMMIAMIAHAIVRHRLMNIRLVIRRGVVYLLAAAAAGGVFVSLLGLMTTLVFTRPRDLPLWIEVSLVLLIALLFQPLRRWIQTSMDRYLYRESYDYQRTIRETSRTMGTMLDLKPLLNYVCEIIARTVRPEAVWIYIRNPEGDTCAQMASLRLIEDRGGPGPGTTLNDDSPLLSLLARTRDYLLRDDVGRVTPNDATRDALAELARFGGETAFPILHEEHMIGCLVVAPKLSGDPYFAEDIDLLSTLVGQAAIAIRNAQLYQEVTLVNEYVANIVATMESGVIAVGANGKITLFNPAAERITGLSAQVMRSEHTSSLPVTLGHPLEATLSDGKPSVQVETTISDATGRLIPVSCSTYSLGDRSGTALGAVAVFTDLSSLRELEAERRRAERLASFSALASGIAHEIKNPLVAIRTFAELLPERFTEEDFRGDFSNVVLREIERIDDLVARLRGLAAPSAQFFAPFDLREPIEETLALLRAQLEQKRIRVHRLFDPKAPAVAGDPAQLKQLFLNLFMNALEAMEPGEKLTISLQSRTKHNTSTVLVRVTDTGSGIPESILGKIFDPFITSKPTGSGLGLAICRGITDSIGATIRAENNPRGRGTTITIEFPPAIAIAAAMNI